MKITDSEWQIMRIVWVVPGLSSNQIFDYISENEEIQWKKTTVKTMLYRLLKKEVLRCEVKEKKYFYYANLSEAEWINTAVKEFSERACAKYIPKAIFDLTKAKQMSIQDIDNLEKLLQEKKKTASNSITCSCL